MDRVSHLHSSIVDAEADLGWRARAVWRSVMLAAMFAEAGIELAVTRPSTRVARAAWLHRFCKRSMRRMDIEITVQGSFPASGALIANHQSYLDIITLAALRPCVFVSKVEVAKVPVVGWMTTMSGTVYVERGRGSSAAKASVAMQAASAAGLPVVFFPEGTTNTSSDLLPFRSGLLGQVMLAGEPITAAYLRYSLGAVNGSDVSVAENVAWGDLPMFTHVFRFLGLREVQAEVRFAPGPIVFSSEGLHRKAAALEARAAVAEAQHRSAPM